MKITLNQSSEYLNENGFKYKGRSTTYRTMRTMNDNGLLKTEKIYLGENRFVYVVDVKVLDRMIRKHQVVAMNKFEYIKDNVVTTDRDVR